MNSLHSPANHDALAAFARSVLVGSDEASFDDCSLCAEKVTFGRFEWRLFVAPGSQGTLPVLRTARSARLARITRRGSCSSAYRRSAHEPSLVAADQCNSVVDLAPRNFRTGLCSPFSCTSVWL